MKTFTYTEVLILNTTFFLFGSGLYVYGLCFFMMGVILYALIEHIFK